MYTVDVSVKGTAPLLQHKFPVPDYVDISKGARKQTGATDYTQEWKEYLYVNGDGEIFQPAAHFEGTMIKAAVNFKIQGKGNKTFKDLFRATVFVSPEEILHGIKEPEDLTTDADEPLYLDIRPVVISRARVIRIRPAFKSGWKLDFTIEAIDDSVYPELINDVLALAGKTVGIGDFRPKFGRFMITRFEVNQ